MRWEREQRLTARAMLAIAVVGLLLTYVAIAWPAHLWPFHGPAAGPDVRIDVAGSRVDPPGYETAQAEYVCLVNAEDRAVSLAGWQLHDAERLVNVLPQFELAAHTSVRVHPGRGRDSRTDLYGTRSRPVWNNDADTITLLDEHGRTVDEATYGASAARARGAC